MSYRHAKQEGGHVAGQHLRKSFSCDMGKRSIAAKSDAQLSCLCSKSLHLCRVSSQMGLEGIVRECKYVVKWEKGIRRRSWIKSIVRGEGSKDGQSWLSTPYGLQL